MAKLLREISQHYEMWAKDNDKRLHRKNGWNDITDAYWGKLPNDWPYSTKIVDPRIRTSIVEKNGRLLNNKLRGRLVPRESSDDLGARLNNAVLDFQWDNANHGGSMQMKLGIADQDTRLYGSKFAYVYWLYEKDEEGNVVFDGNEFMPLDIRNCGIDPTATHIRDAKWFQLQSWDKFEDLENACDASGKPLYKNLGKVRTMLDSKMSNSKSSSKNTEWVSRVKHLKGLDDRTGEDIAYPVIKKVIEFRRDRMVTFLPDFDEIIQDVKNPYDHKMIPIAQLRYYSLQDDPLGESEVEPVLPIWKAIQATICAYMDEVILKMRPPLKIIENAARVETIQRGPDAQWLVDRQDAIEEMRSNGESLQYFQTTYQTLVSAFNVAMGDLSAQNSSGLDPFSNDAKTATEVRATVRQQNMRDQKNQNDLAEFIKDIMMMWLSNNRQFLFSDPKKVEHVIRILGKDQYETFRRAGMADTEVPPEAMEMISDIIYQKPNISDSEISQLVETASMPKYPVIMNPKEKDPTKIELKPKMRISEHGDVAEISLIPQDLQGTYDYIPDVKSMAAGAGQEMAQARERAIERLTTNPTVLQLLSDEGWRPNVKELYTADFEDSGLRDAERFFRKIENGQATQGTTQMGGTPANSQLAGLPQSPQAPAGVGVPEQMARPYASN